MKTRAYRMVARAAQAEGTHRAILEAARALFQDRDLDEVALSEVAERAGVTLQTVLRRFGSKQGLIDATISHALNAVEAEREPAGPGEALATLVASYEAMGERNWRLLRQEAGQPAIHQALEGARALHRRWLGAQFAHLLPARGAERERRLDALFAVTDFYVWKLQRMDLGRSRAATLALMEQLVAALERSWT